MTEQTLEEHARETCSRLASMVWLEYDLRVNPDAHQILCDFARAHAERETAILRETLAQYERDFTKFAELERKRIVEIVDLRAENERLRESLRISDEQINGMNDAGLKHDAELADRTKELESARLIADDVHKALWKSDAELAALRARLARIEAANESDVKRLSDVSLHFKPGSKALTPNGCDDCGLNYCHCAASAPTAAVPRAFNLIAHLERQRAFSLKTFGPGARTKGVIDHIRKELAEIEAEPTDISEWVDVIILAFDGAWRAGWEPAETVAAIVAKQTKNEGRVWPDWRTSDPDKAIEHDRRHDDVTYNNDEALTQALNEIREGDAS